MSPLLYYGPKELSVHSHWITEHFKPGSKYSPYCPLIVFTVISALLINSETPEYLVHYTLIGLNCVQCFCIFLFRFGETNICCRVWMAEDTALPRILSYGTTPCA